MIPEELFGKIIKYHLLDQEQEADDIRKGLEKKLDAMVNREVYSKSKTAPTEEERLCQQHRPAGLGSFDAQSLSLLPIFLRLTFPIALAGSRSLPAVWLIPYRMGFHPLNASPLAGRTGTLLVKR